MELNLDEYLATRCIDRGRAHSHRRVVVGQVRSRVGCASDETGLPPARKPWLCVRGLTAGAAHNVMHASAFEGAGGQVRPVLTPNGPHPERHDLASYVPQGGGDPILPSFPGAPARQLTDCPTRLVHRQDEG